MEKPAAAVFAEVRAFPFLSIVITESVNKFAPGSYEKSVIYEVTKRV